MLGGCGCETVEKVWKAQFEKVLKRCEWCCGLCDDVVFTLVVVAELAVV